VYGHRKIAIGVAPPHDVNALIEIPSGGVPVKYELDKASGALRVDGSAHRDVLSRELRLHPAHAFG
jgi:inorganic pyrophosphatase